MLFNEYPIQHNARSTTLYPSAYTGSSSDNAIRLNGQKLSSPTYESCSTTASGANGEYYKIEMKA